MASYPCSDDPSEVIEAIVGAGENAEKFDRFVNGGVYEEVQLGEGQPTPTLRNVVHLVKSAAATLDGSDVSGKFSDAANGGTELRMLSDRFGDYINVKDFGAVGDGVTDDAAAFRAAALARGTAEEATEANPIVCDVYVPHGSYLLNSDPLTDEEYDAYGNANFIVYWHVESSATFLGDGSLKSPVVKSYPVPKNLNWFHKWQKDVGGRLYAGPNFSKILMLTEPNAPMDTHNILSAVQTKDGTIKRDWTAFNAHAINNHESINHKCWGAYVEAARMNDFVGSAIAAEIDPINASGEYHRVNPFTQSYSQTIGIQIAAGAEYPNLNHADCSAAIQIAGRENTSENGLSRFGVGINIMARALRGCTWDAEAQTVTGAGIAIAMSRCHRIAWYTKVDEIGSYLECYTSDKNKGYSISINDGNVSVYHTVGGEKALFIDGGNDPDMGLKIDCHSYESGVIIDPISTTKDNVDIILKGKGSGYVRLGVLQVVGNITCNKYIRIKDGDGNIIRIPCVSEA